MPADRATGLKKGVNGRLCTGGDGSGSGFPGRVGHVTILI